MDLRDASPSHLGSTLLGRLVTLWRAGRRLGCYDLAVPDCPPCRCECECRTSPDRPVPRTPWGLITFVGTTAAVATIGYLARVSIGRMLEERLVLARRRNEEPIEVLPDPT